MKNQKINFFVGDINTIGGVEKVTLILAKEFIHRGAYVTIHSIYSKSSNNQSEEMTIHHYGLLYPDEEINISNKIKRLMANGLVLRREIGDSLNTEISIFQGFYVSTYIPFIKTRNSSIFVCEHNSFDAVGKASKIARKYIYRKFSPHVIVLTDSDKSSFLKIGIKNVTKILNPSPFPVIQKDRGSKVGSNLIALGRFTSQKRFDRMITMCSETLMKHVDWKLIIQGQGPELEAMKVAAIKSGVSAKISIIPAGDPQELYQKGAIFLMTSLFEGLPMTLIESMSFGIPAVCYNCSPGLAEIIKDGINGYLIEMDNSKSFIDKVTQLMENPLLRKQMGDSAKRMAEKFSVSNVILDWEKILK